MKFQYLGQTTKKIANDYINHNLDIVLFSGASITVWYLNKTTKIQKNQYVTYKVMKQVN